MNLEKNCEQCGNIFVFPHWRLSTAKFCSKECSSESRVAKPNVTCTFCGKLFHMKKYQQDRYNRNRGFYCSHKCQHAHLSEVFKGNSNHQFGLKGELNTSFKGDILKKKNNNLLEYNVYSPGHPYGDKSNRVYAHRIVVEDNFNNFDIDSFDIINGKHYLKRKLHVHHINGNHNDNSVCNLQIVTRSEHTRIHNKNKIITRDSLGRIKSVNVKNELDKL